MPARKSLYLVALVVLLIAGTAMADQTYTVFINTSTINLTHGSLDLQFNPGPGTFQPATAALTGLSGGTPDGAPSVIGDVIGTLPVVSFDNGTFFNDYFDGYTYGSSLTFHLTLCGPAMNSPNGTSTSGSSFVLSLFSDLNGTVPVLSSDTTTGIGIEFDINTNGSVAVTNNIQGATVTVPEPGSIALLGSGLLGLVAIARKKLR